MVEETKKEQTFTKAQVEKMMAEMKAEFLKGMQQPQQVIQVSKDEYVTVLYIGVMADNASVSLGKLGRINRAGTLLDISKKEFIQSLGTPLIDNLLRKRSLIVVNGLTQEDRVRYGLDYADGELLTQDKFFKLLDLEPKEICSIFSKLCDEHKKTVAKMYYSAYFERNDNRVHVDTVKKLNKLSKTIDKNGLFTPILEDMGSKFVSDED